MPEKEGKNAEIDALIAELSTSQATAASGVPFPHASALFHAEGDIHPGSKLNPTKATPSRIEVIDSGPATIFCHYLDRRQNPKAHSQRQENKRRMDLILTGAFRAFDGTQRRNAKVWRITNAKINSFCFGNKCISGLRSYYSNCSISRGFRAINCKMQDVKYELRGAVHALNHLLRHLSNLTFALFIVWSKFHRILSRYLLHVKVDW